MGNILFTVPVLEILISIEGLTELCGLVSSVRSSKVRAGAIWVILAVHQVSGRFEVKYDLIFQFGHL